jgi:carbon-monoxide dehydrogenase large subunit
MKRFVGQRIPRREDMRHLRGRAQFVPDLPGDGVLEVAFVRSQEAHAVIRRVDLSAALSVAGVAGALTIDDCRRLSRPFTPNISPPGLQQFSWYALAGDRVRFAGDLVAAVAAVDRYTAEDAAELVDVDYESLPPVVTPAVALAPDAPLLYPDWSDNVLFHRTFSAGDVEAGLPRRARRRARAVHVGAI